MNSIAYFIEIDSPNITEDFIEKPLIGVESAEHFFSCQVSHDKDVDLNLHIYSEKWAIKTVAINEGLIRIPLNSERKDIHFKVTSLESAAEILIYGCIQFVDKLPNPVFVVGSPRSGTSIAANTLREVLHSKHSSETHIITAFADIETQLNKNFYNSRASQINGMALSSFPKSYVKAELIKLIRGAFSTTYMNSFFIDKTPGKLMISMLDLALYAFPKAKIVFCKRRAIENVISRMDKFPTMSFQQHLEGWVKCFSEWTAIKLKMSSILKTRNWYVELDQYHIANSPRSAASKLACLLGLDIKLEVKISEKFSTNKPETKNLSIRPIKSLASAEWSDEERSLFLKICQPTMTEQGYSLDEYYFSNKHSET